MRTYRIQDRTAHRNTSAGRHPDHDQRLARLVRRVDHGLSPTRCETVSLPVLQPPAEPLARPWANTPAATAPEVQWLLFPAEACPAAQEESR